MRLLHTSDWHLGHTLCGRRRYAEFAAFFQWLLAAIDSHQVGTLIVAGDIFDSSTPSNRAQQLYYQFLKAVTAGCCRQVIIIGGNHDSPSLLEAPRELLRAFDIHVIGNAGDPDQEVLVLPDRNGREALIVCAVPYLRDRDLRTARAGESVDDKNRCLLQGIADHYRQVVEIAERRRAELDRAVPLVATGHLFVAGGQRLEGDGVRDLYVGSLVHVDGSLLPAAIDYLALGHLHSPQMVGGNPTRRYSGSPMPMGFQDAGRSRQVLLVDLDNDAVSVTPLAVPCFQQLQSLRGDLADILAGIAGLKQTGESVLVEVIYDGHEQAPLLQTTLREATADSQIEILRIINVRLQKAVFERHHAQESLDDLSEEAVFTRCLASHEVPEAAHQELVALFRQTLQSLADEDSLAE